MTLIASLFFVALAAGCGGSAQPVAQSPPDEPDASPGTNADADTDSDGFRDFGERVVGSDPNDAKSRPEFVALDDDVCGDAQDNDLDGDTDEEDKGCQDSDSDTYPDYLDNCPEIENRDQFDADGDGRAVECDEDDDGDGVNDHEDACEFTELNAQVDRNGCSDLESDDDGDGFCNPSARPSDQTGCERDDNCPADANPSQANADRDQWGDACDNCRDIKNNTQADADSDGYGNICDPTPMGMPRNEPFHPTLVLTPTEQGAIYAA